MNSAKKKTNIKTNIKHKGMGRESQKFYGKLSSKISKKHHGFEKNQFFTYEFKIFMFTWKDAQLKKLPQSMPNIEQLISKVINEN